MSKKQFGLLFKAACAKCGQAPNVEKIHVFDEPHKRYNKNTGLRETHKHLIFKMKSGFGHTRLQTELANRGVYGHFSFNLVGYVAYLRYCLMPSAKKLLVDVDQRPWSWPPIEPASLLALCDQPSPQMDARNDVGNTRGRKRKLLTFSEITDAFVDGKVKCEQDAWRLAKARKVAGDDTLFNTLGATRSVHALVAKVRSAWNCEEMSTGTLVVKPEYKLCQFVPMGSIDMALLSWLQGGWRQQALVIYGPAGLGKTELACALVHTVSPAKAFHFLNKVDRLRDVIFSPGEGLVVDEACLATRDADDAKSLVDMKKTRDVTCRNADGVIPRGTPRVFSTNWPWEQFWPHDAFSAAHLEAIKRRVLWVVVGRDVRRLPGAVVNAGGSARADISDGATSALPLYDDEDEADPFEHGFCS